jgi:hypothetical protein
MAQELFRAALKNDAETIQNIQSTLKDIRGSRKNPAGYSLHAEGQLGMDCFASLVMTE